MGIRSEAHLFRLYWQELWDMLDAVAWYNRKSSGEKEPTKPVDVAKKEEWLARAAERDRMIREREKCQTQAK